MSNKRKRGNYWTPLQAFVEDDDGDPNDMDEEEPQVSKQPEKEFVPPIKVIAQSCEFIHSLLNKKCITNYRLQRISIGTKVLCDTLSVYEVVKTLLSENKCQFYTHDKKSDRAFKVVLYGLENKSESELKQELIVRGLKCQHVKRVDKTYEGFTDTLYIVCFECGSLKINELRRSHKCLFRTIVRWEYQRRNKNRIIQCHNCQMLGHGERGCFMKTRCSHCAGKHKTSECNTTNTIKCANCNGEHKSTFGECPNRVSFMNIRNRIMSKRNVKPQPRSRKEFSLDPAQFPPQKQSFAPAMNNFSNNNLSYSNQLKSHQLFSESEMLQLTSEIISKLRDCSSKEQQFSVITQLAIKYLYSNINP